MTGGINMTGYNININGTINMTGGNIISDSAGGFQTIEMKKGGTSRVYLQPDDVGTYTYLNASNSTNFQIGNGSAIIYLVSAGKIITAGVRGVTTDNADAINV